MLVLFCLEINQLEWQTDTQGRLNHSAQDKQGFSNMVKEVKYLDIVLSHNAMLTWKINEIILTEGWGRAKGQLASMNLLFGMT